eukprot:363451-Chlamydomonas_euryale.AAC.9
MGMCGRGWACVWMGMCADGHVWPGMMPVRHCLPRRPTLRGHVFARVPARLSFFPLQTDMCARMPAPRSFFPLQTDMCARMPVRLSCFPLPTDMCARVHTHHPFMLPAVQTSRRSHGLVHLPWVTHTHVFTLVHVLGTCRLPRLCRHNRGRVPVQPSKAHGARSAWPRGLGARVNVSGGGGGRNGGVGCRVRRQEPAAASVVVVVVAHGRSGLAAAAVCAVARAAAYADGGRACRGARPRRRAAHAVQRARARVRQGRGGGGGRPRRDTCSDVLAALAAADGGARGSGGDAVAAVNRGGGGDASGVSAAEPRRRGVHGRAAQPRGPHHSARAVPVAAGDANRPDAAGARARRMTRQPQAGIVARVHAVWSSSCGQPAWRRSMLQGRLLGWCMVGHAPRRCAAGAQDREVWGRPTKAGKLLQGLFQGLQQGLFGHLCGTTIIPRSVPRIAARPRSSSERRPSAAGSRACLVSSHHRTLAWRSGATMACSRTAGTADALWPGGPAQRWHAAGRSEQQTHSGLAVRRNDGMQQDGGNSRHARHHRVRGGAARQEGVKLGRQLSAGSVAGRAASRTVLRKGRPSRLRCTPFQRRSSWLLLAAAACGRSHAGLHSWPVIGGP